MDFLWFIGFAFLGAVVTGIVHGAQKKTGQPGWGANFIGFGLSALIVLGVRYFVSGGGPTPEEIAAESAAAAEEKRKGFHCLSSWDGSHREVVRLVEAQLKDPDSFEHIETRITPVSADGSHTLAMQYRARNGFGGMAVGTATATINNATCDATLLSVE